MAKKPYFPNDSLNQVVWLTNFKDKLPTYNTKYGISAAELSATTDDIEWYKNWFDIHLGYSKFCTKPYGL